MAKNNTNSNATGETADEQVNGQGGEQATAEKAKSKSGKSKADRGVPEGYVSSWFAIDLSPEDKGRLEKYCKVHNTTVKAALTTMGTHAFHNVYKEQIDAAVAEFDGNPDKFAAKTSKPKKDLSQMSQEELQKLVEREEKALASKKSAVDKAREMIAAAQARAAGAQ